MTPLLDISDLRIVIGSNQFLLERITCQLQPGETLGIIGSSGSGKSLTAWSILGIAPQYGRIEGQIRYYNENGVEFDMTSPSRRGGQKVVGRHIGLIPQNPFTSLNPAIQCGRQVQEMLRDTDEPRHVKRRKVLDKFRELRFDDPGRIYRAYPHELSGGQLQRVVIAIATINEPRLLIADEPTTALDTITQQQIVQWLKSWCMREDRSLIFVSHDIDVVASLCDRLILIENGRVTMSGTTQKLLESGLPETIRKSTTSGARTGKISVQTSSQPLVQMRNISKTYTSRSGRGAVRALKQVDLDVYRGECVGIVGSTGCGKSTIARLLVGLTQPDSGQMLFEGRHIDYRANPGLRAKIQMIFQDPYSALYPHKNVHYCIAEALRLHRKLNSDQLDEAAEQLIARVGLTPDMLGQSSITLSGGERQRVQIARALAVQPECLICDECVSGLDAGVQGRIIALLKTLQVEEDLTILFISHNLDVVRDIAQRVIVMAHGEIVEQGSTETIFNTPVHPVTRSLIAAIPAIVR